MTKIKMCGLTCSADIAEANRLKPGYAGFVFAPKSRRHVTPEKAVELKKQLNPEIQAVGVFVDENPETVAKLLEEGVIDVAQLHGQETEEEIRELKVRTGKPVIRAFRLKSFSGGKELFSGTKNEETRNEADRERLFAERILKKAETCCADYVLLDSGSGCGETFDWSLLKDFGRPYFLAGGLDPENVSEAVRRLRPYAVDVSSGIETGGRKDPQKMEAFVRAVRLADNHSLNRDQKQ